MESETDFRAAIEQLTEHISEIDKRIAESYSERERSYMSDKHIQIDAHSIVRFGERIGFMEEKIKDVKDEIGKLIHAFDKYQEKADNIYVTKTDFEPIRKLVYGAVGLILVTVLSAFMLLVVISNSVEYKVINEPKIQGSK